MKQLSSWGKKHPVHSRLIIIASFVVITISGVVAAELLRSLGVVIPFIFFLLMALMTLYGWIYYPAKKDNPGKSKLISYRRQKRFDLLLSLCTIGLVIYAGNRTETLGTCESLLASSTTTSLQLGDSASKTYKSIPVFLASMKDAHGRTLKWKERKKLLKEQVAEIRKANDLPVAAKIALIILSVGVAVLLAYGVAILACSAACSGSEALAIFILIAGTALIVFLLLWAIRKIVGYKKRNKLFHP